MTSDPYRILGLPQDASAAEVKRAYRALAKANHPDSAGEKALPRFLAIQAAYEQLTIRTLRPGSRTRTASRPTEAWRADAGRARDARSGSRSGGQERAGGTTGPAAGGAAPGSRGRGDGDQARADGRPAGGTRAGTGAGPRSRAGAGPGGARPSDTPGGAGKAPGGARRRGTRKATFGSTTYDEVRDPVDPTWQGASWYGPSSGEYWTVNPREYADPRKHGPEYQARAAARAARAAEREAAAARDAYATADTSARAQAAARAAAASRAAAVARAEARRLEREAAEQARYAAADEGRGESSDGTVPPIDLTFGFDSRRLETLPYRRGILALAAWPPLGIAAASLIGDATGCAVFSASCTTAATFYPWIAQIAIVVFLLLLPALARVLAGGTIAVAVLAFPVAAALSASGAAYDAVHGPPSLIAILAVVWILGVGLMAMRLRRPGPAG